MECFITVNKQTNKRYTGAALVWDVWLDLVAERRPFLLSDSQALECAQSSPKSEETEAHPSNTVPCASEAHCSQRRDMLLLSGGSRC